MVPRETILLDANVLVALTSPDHAHHRPAHTWMQRVVRFATCPLTQLALIRLLMQFGVRSVDAVAALEAIRSHRRHAFWPDDVEVDAQSMRAVIGHRQVTDGYLVALARRHGGRLATFDAGLAAVHADAVELLPTHDSEP